MNAQSNIVADSDSKFIALAHSVLAGHWPQEYLVDYPLYSEERWLAAAQAAIDCEDTEEFEWMLAQEAEHDREERSERWEEHRVRCQPVPPVPPGARVWA